MSRIIATVLVAAVLILPTLFAGGNLVLLLLPKAEALTIEIDITTDTTWGDKTIFPGTIYNIAPGATLTIKGKVTNNGDINVYGTLDIVYPKGELYVTKQGKEMGTLYVHSGRHSQQPLLSSCQWLTRRQPWRHTLHPQRLPLRCPRHLRYLSISMAASSMTIHSLSRVEQCSASTSLPSSKITT